MEFEWMQTDEDRWETADQTLAGEICRYQPTDRYIGIAHLTDYDNHTYRSKIVGLYKTAAVAQQAVEQQLDEWRLLAVDETHAEHAIYEHEQNTQRRQ